MTETMTFKSRKTVLFVDSNVNLNDKCKSALELYGCNVLTAFTLKKAREYLSECDPEVLLISVVLPDGDGIEFCKEICQRVTSHIIFLDKKTARENYIKCLEEGGDDYLTEPYLPDEMILRIRAAIRSYDKLLNRVTQSTEKLGELTINRMAQRVLWRGRDLNLTTKEYAILNLLAQRKGSYVSSEELYSGVWAMSPLDVQSVKQHVYKLRKKFAAEGVDVAITQKRSVGYRLVV